MRAIAFNGSPRKGGNTEFLLRKVLEPISEAGIENGAGPDRRKTNSRLHRVLQVQGKQEPKCAIDSDMVNECIGKMIAADAIILGSPTYFAGMTSEMKALIDRAGFVAGSNGRLFARKIGAGVVVHRRGGATSVLDSINHMFLISRMIIPGSTYWNFGVGLAKGDVENRRGSPGKHEGSGRNNRLAGKGPAVRRAQRLTK